MQGDKHKLDDNQETIKIIESWINLSFSSGKEISD